RAALDARGHGGSSVSEGSVEIEARRHECAADAADAAQEVWSSVLLDAERFQVVDGPAADLVPLGWVNCAALAAQEPGYPRERLDVSAPGPDGRDGGLESASLVPVRVEHASDPVADIVKLWLEAQCLHVRGAGSILIPTPEQGLSQEPVVSGILWRDGNHPLELFACLGRPSKLPKRQAPSSKAGVLPGPLHAFLPNLKGVLELAHMSVGQSQHIRVDPGTAALHFLVRLQRLLRIIRVQRNVA